MIREALIAALIAAPASATTRAQAPSETGWPRHGFDAEETRYSPLDQIRADNVHRLKAAWSWEIPKPGERVETTPLVVDGVLYGTGPWSYVFALDAATGKTLWTWDPGIPTRDEGGPRTCCGDVNRGAAISGDRLFVGLLDGRLAALDRADGSLLWIARTTPAGSDYSITGAPRVVGDKVVVGNAGAEFGVRGYVGAYEAETGLPAWRTYTVPGNPALGHEDESMAEAAKTWTGEWWRAGGGGTVWDGVAHDEEAGLVYVGTGNGSPWSRDHRSPDGGDNLYLSSILALDAEDGKIVWHYQTTPGDDWDYTATQHLMLLDIELDGKLRRTIVQAPKNGFFYVLDRITGELLSAEPFADDLTWATRVDMTTGRPVETPAARYGRSARGAYLAPGTMGAHNWQSMSWNPSTGLVYVPAQNNYHYYKKARSFRYRPRRWNTGTESGVRLLRPPRPEPRGPSRLLLAWDPAANREAWRLPGEGGHGGTASTAGNLVFWTIGGLLIAVNAGSGEKLWSFDVGRDAGAPVTYMVAGRQYVATASGHWASDQPSRVWAFALGADGGGPR